MLTDSHCHLASENFSSDLDQVIKRSATAKVSRMVTISTDLEDSSKCIEIAKNNNLYGQTIISDKKIAKKLKLLKKIKV